MICNLFPLAGFLMFFFVLDESPAFLVRSERSAAALKVLRKIYATNSGKPAETYEVSTAVKHVTFREIIVLRCDKK